MNTPIYTSRPGWSATRPQALVVCCSDGRLQNSIDDFLQGHLGIFDYDRLYAPGGPAALADSSSEYTRTNTFRRDLEFLFRAHEISEVILIFHGAAAGVPEEAACAHYRRTLPGATHGEMTRRQIADMAEVVHYITAFSATLSVKVFRAEVQSDGSVYFLDLAAVASETAAPTPPPT